MRDTLKKRLWREVQDELARQMPHVSEIKGEPLPRVCRLYGWGDGGPLTFFVMFQADRYDDAFTVEIGWSKDGHWPQAFKLRPPDPDVDETDGARFRLGRLWMDSDVWWSIDAERGDLDVSTQVGNAVRCVATQGARYLSRIQGQFGRKPNSLHGDSRAKQRSEDR